MLHSVYNENSYLKRGKGVFNNTGDDQKNWNRQHAVFFFFFAFSLLYFTPIFKL